MAEDFGLIVRDDDGNRLPVSAAGSVSLPEGQTVVQVDARFSDDNESVVLTLWLMEEDAT